MGRDHDFGYFCVRTDIFLMARSLGQFFVARRKPSKSKSPKLRFTPYNIHFEISVYASPTVAPENTKPFKKKKRNSAA